MYNLVHLPLSFLMDNVKPVTKLAVFVKMLLTPAQLVLKDSSFITDNASNNALPKHLNQTTLVLPAHPIVKDVLMLILAQHAPLNTFSKEQPVKLNVILDTSTLMVLAHNALLVVLLALDPMHVRLAKMDSNLMKVIVHQDVRMVNI